MRRCIRVK